MSIPFFVPPVHYKSQLVLGRSLSLAALCAELGLSCRASGPWTQRQVEVKAGSEFKIEAEAGDWGAVKIEAPVTGRMNRAKLALVVLAYGLHDLVAKESIKNVAWSDIRPPRGRPRKQRALSTRERQRRFRARHAL